ncbi:LOW QUALITY PROTEIN: cTAGE family member 2-like, partial [Callospermophilus lateralis]
MKLKASFEILEGVRNQKCTFSSEVEKTTEDLTEHLKSLQTEQASLQSENAQLQSENETPQKNFKVMMERYQENMMKLHRELRVEEKYRVEQEEKLSKVEEKMSHTITELETYRKRAQYLEELQSTIRSSLGKIISSDKEADASELAAWIAERNLSYFRKQNARNRQKLTEKELRFELVEKDPYDALDVSNSGMGRNPSPNGPSLIGHPSSERRPPHFEKSGPLTLSPFTPVGGGRGSRGPGNPLDHATSSKGRESSCHKFTDFQRAPSQTGPLSPPGEQASRLMIPPPGQPYSSDARLPLQRQDRFYSNCGRASGPAEHRIPNMPPLDSDVPDSALHAENQATGPGSVLAPFPPIRGALFPVDPRLQFIRRGPFFSSTSPRKLWVVLEEAPRVVAALSEDMKPGHLPYGFPWELVVCTALGFFAVLSLFWRGFQSVRSRLYVGREKRLALNLAGLIEAKCGLLEKVSLVEKEHEGLESSLKDCRFEKGSREAQQLEATDEKLHRSESSHGVEMLFLEEELKAQKAQQGQQDETMAHLSRRIQSLQGESESLRSQIAEAKTNWRLFQVNEEELKLAIKEDESKGALRNLVYGDKLKASLEILEGGRNQKCTFSSEVEKTTEDLTEHLKSLQTEQASLQSENAQLQSENETLQENFKVMMERYQENMMKLHRKLRVEENYRVEQEEKLSKVEEKMSHTIKELETYRKRAQYLEEQLQSTIRSCLGKIISSEKEADASELEARIAERNLSYFRKQNARNRQKLTEKELRFELVEKDPYDALDVSNSAMGRKPSPNGPSPIGHPSSERRPPHFEKSGPLTLSPFTPVGGGRGSRGPGNPLDHATSSKGRESSCHKFTDFQRAPSQTGPLSPPGEQASRLMIPPPGQPYSSDARLPLQRQDRFYSNCGRASGPAEHRIPNMPPLDSD